MKKFNLLIALALFAGPVASFTASAQAPAPAQDDKAAQQVEFERKWYDTCYTKKDAEQCYVQSKEMMEKYPGSTYNKNATSIVKTTDQNKAWEKFQTALKTFYTQQTMPNYQTLITAGTEIYKFAPDEPQVVAQLAIAGYNAVLGPIQSKDFDGPKANIEKGLTVFESSTPAKEFKPETWAVLRELVQTQGNQFLAYRLSETNGDQEQALGYLAKAIAIKGKDGAGWKDPLNYYLRSIIYNKKYAELSKQYTALTDEQKTADAGKEALKQINALLDTKLLPEYARIMATATKPDTKPYYDQAKQSFDALWKYRTDAPEKATAYLEAFKADPTVAGPEVPAKAEDNTTLGPSAPAVGGTAVKPITSGGSSAPGAATNGNGAKATPAKSTPAAKKKAGKSRRR